MTKHKKAKYDDGIPSFLKISAADRAKGWKENKEWLAEMAASGTPTTSIKEEPDDEALRALEEELDLKRKNKTHNRIKRMKEKKEESVIPAKFRVWSTKLSRFIDSREGEKEAMAKVMKSKKKAPVKTAKSADKAARVERVIDLHKKGGLSQHEIAEETGLTRSGVWGILNKHGLLKKQAAPAKKKAKKKKKAA